MPLVVPGITSNDPVSKTEEWYNKLVGKTLSDGPSDSVSFAKADLPEEKRIIQPRQPVTLDFNPRRLNIYLAEDGTVTDVNFR